MTSALVVARPAHLAVAPELAASAKSYARASKAPRTVAAYRSAWLAFEAWCDSTGGVALPASAECVALYLTARADAGRKPATIGLDLAAIGEAHRLAGHPSPTTAPAVSVVLAGIRRTLGVAQERKAPLLAGDLCRALEFLPAGLLGQRDAALLLVGFAGAFRRSELVGLNAEDLAFSAEGLTITLRRSKTDQEGEGRAVALPYSVNPKACPVRVLRAWLEAAGITAGPVFRGVNRHGTAGQAALTGRAVAMVVKRSAKAAGLDPSRFSGHSLRAGFATAAAKRGKSERAIMRQTGHKSVAMLHRYIREAELWSDNAAAGLLD